LSQLCFIFGFTMLFYFKPKAIAVILTFQDCHESTPLKAKGFRCRHLIGFIIFPKSITLSFFLVSTLFYLWVYYVILLQTKSYCCHSYLSGLSRINSLES